MRYFMTIIPPADINERDVSPEFGTAMETWLDESIASGELISTGGLQPAKFGKRLAGHTGKIATTDGPFAEAKEVVGGYIVYEAPDMDGAVALGSKFMQMHIDYGLPDTIFEIRQIAGGKNY
jgi:hypothetical protein